MSAAAEIELTPGADSVELPVVARDGDGWALLGSRCPGCGQTYYPPRRLCPADLGECEQIQLSRRGKIHAAALVQRPPLGFDGPFPVAYVDLPEGVRIFAQLRWEADRDPQGGDEVELDIGPVRAEPPVVGPRFAGP